FSEAGRKAAAAVNYRGAGTIEFILDANGKFYFLEMNTRLQVEHPVTELVYGVDLVKQQIMIAAGEHLDVQQKDVSMRGHSIEMRIYAEDATRGFMPSIGRINRLVLPSGPGVRNENGVYAGYDIPIYYDPMIGKLVVWAETRDAAIRRARRALREYRCEPVRTNVDFLLWALHEPSFLDGSYTTKTIETVFKPDSLPARNDDLDLAAVAAAIAAYNYRNTVHHIDIESDASNNWRRAARADGTHRWPS
ncbi:MAG TPA: acetyl-CoA carboxylase biotin carboxylase subunit, partial [Candidatus Krumholzibacteria bacterium]|nr:acetyl-CoA carboxylase biotin carboxylase subunit [Candidatus Krumholzibacteria bacterium]